MQVAAFLFNPGGVASTGNFSLGEIGLHGCAKLDGMGRQAAAVVQNVWDGT
eukprot:SAG22_NODE_14235_length_381_cov_0.546099_1_plen_50_part_10